MDKVLNQADMKTDRTVKQVSAQQSEEQTTERTPDCVTVLHKGNKIITARGFFNQTAKESAVEKMERVIRIAGEASGY